jgi:Transglycosylase associated protein.
MSSMGFIAWIVVGAIAGFLANQVMGSREGLLMMVVLGIVGGLVGGFVATNVLKIGTVDGINVESIAIATLGAIAVVFVANFANRSGGFRRG